MNKAMNEAQEKANKTMAKVDIQTLKQSAIELSSRTDSEADIAWILLMNHLEARMSESEFISFCDSL